MDTQDFVEKLSEASDLMAGEKYKEAIILLEKLKKIDEKGEFDYNLTHKLYQLLSNSHSLYNQKIILTYLRDISKQQKSITFSELNKVLKENKELDIEDAILRREVEILILRNLLNCKLEGNKIVLNLL